VRVKLRLFMKVRKSNYNLESRNSLIVASGCAPTNSSMTFPSLNSFTEGIDITPYLFACSEFFSVSAFAKMNFPS